MFIEEGTLITVRRYKEMLEAKGIKAVDCTVDGKDPTSLPHILHMCNVLLNKIVPGSGAGYSVDKYSRWLGYIQAIMIVNKLTTVENERNVTRPLFTR